MKKLTLQKKEAAVLQTAAQKDAQLASQDHGEPEAESQAPFPLEALGDTLAAMGRAICAAERVPASLAGSCLLGVTSAAIGAGLRVRDTPSRSTRGNLFILAGSVTGCGKSAAFRHAAKPLQEEENGWLEMWQKHVAPAARAKKEDLEAERAEAKKSGFSRKASPATRADTRKRLAEIDLELQKLEKTLVCPVIIAEDFTSEKLAVMLEASGEQLAVLSPDAVAPLRNIAGRYRKGADTDEGIFLKGYTGEAHKVARMNRPPVMLSSPCLTVLLLTQPDLVDELLKNDRLNDGGFLPRFLICQTGAKPEKIDRNAPPIPASVEEGYKGLITGLLETFRLAECPSVIDAEPEAEKLLNTFHDRIVDRRRHGGDLIDVQGFAARWGENAWRVAVVLHAAKHGNAACRAALDAETATRALEIVQWYCTQQLEVLSAGREKARDDRKAKVLALLAQKPAGITARDLQQRRIAPNPAACRELLAEMEDAGLLAHEEKPGKNGGWTARVYRYATAARR